MIRWCRTKTAFILLCILATCGLAARAGVPVIHCTDLYHPHEDPDDHFDLATMYAIPGVDLQAVVLDQGQRQSREPGSIAVRQLNKITARNIRWAIGLGRNLANPNDKVLEDEPQFQRGAQLILKVLRDSPGRVCIVTLGSCRDVAAAFNRDPDLLRRKIDKLMIFIGDADEKKRDYREYNVNLDRNAFICILRSGLPVYWVPCFDGGVFKNNGHASYWVASHSDLLGRCTPEVTAYFTYALNRKNPAVEDPLAFLSKPANPAERQRLLAGKRNLWCAAVFVSLAEREVVRHDGKWEALPIGSVNGAQPVFSFRQVDVNVADDAAISYGAGERSHKVMRFEVRDKANYAGAMTAVTADLLASLGRTRP